MKPSVMFKLMLKFLLLIILGMFLASLFSGLLRFLVCVAIGISFTWYFKKNIEKASQKYRMAQLYPKR